MPHIWKGPGVLKGLDRSVVAPGEPIPEGHVTPERIRELGDMVEFAPDKTPEPEPELAADVEPNPVPDTEPPPGPPKRKPGRPKGSGRK